MSKAAHKFDIVILGKGVIGKYTTLINYLAAKQRTHSNGTIVSVHTDNNNNLLLHTLFRITEKKWTIKDMESIGVKRLNWQEKDILNDPSKTTYKILTVQTDSDFEKNVALHLMKMRFKTQSTPIEMIFYDADSSSEYKFTVQENMTKEGYYLTRNNHGDGGCMFHSFAALVNNFENVKNDGENFYNSFNNWLKKKRPEQWETLPSYSYIKSNYKKTSWTNPFHYKEFWSDKDGLNKSDLSFPIIIDIDQIVNDKIFTLPLLKQILFAKETGKEIELLKLGSLEECNIIIGTGGHYSVLEYVKPDKLNLELLRASLRDENKGLDPTPELEEYIDKTKININGTITRDIYSAKILLECTKKRNNILENEARQAQQVALQCPNCKKNSISPQVLGVCDLCRYGYEKQRDVAHVTNALLRQRKGPR